MRKKIICFLMIFMVLFGSFDDNKSYAIEPLTATIVASVCSSLALSLGFRLIDSQSENFTQGVMKLYSNFSTNVKNILDRIGNKRMKGSSTFDITPDELQAFGNELSAAINDITVNPIGTTVIQFPEITWDSPSNTYEIKDFKYPEISAHNLFVTYGLDYGDSFKVELFYKDQIYHSYYYSEKIDNTGNLVYTVVNTSDNSWVRGGRVPGDYDSLWVRAYEDGGNPFLRFLFITNERTEVGANLQDFKLVVGNESVSEPPVIGVGDMSVDDLVVALKNKGVLNSQGAITQNFISNFDTALPSDAYNDLNNKTIVDGLFTGFDTTLPDAPADLGILQNIYSVLNNGYINVKTGLSNLYSKVNSIALAISDVFVYDSTLKLDYSGFSNLIIKDRFPFSIPFDLYNSVKMFSASASQPDFNISIHNKFLSVDHTIDISFMHLFILFFRWVCNVWFSMVLILKTRDLIKW